VLDVVLEKKQKEQSDCDPEYCADAEYS
jgi:hypothetical protein